MAKLSYKVSYYIFYVLIALILVVLGLFFCVGYENPVGDYNAPEHTETLLFLMYAMLGVCIAVTVIGSLAQFATTLKDNPKGAAKSLAGVALFAAVLVGAYAIGSAEPIAYAPTNTAANKATPAKDLAAPLGLSFKVVAN
mgnify:CR=1